MTIILIILGAVLTAGLGIFQKIEADEAQKKADKINDELIKSQKELIKAQSDASKKAENQSAEIVRLSKALAEKTSTLLDESEKARVIQLKTINYINGHKYPQLAMQNVSFGKVRPTFINNKSVPIYDMTIIGYDFDAIRGLRHLIRGNEIWFVTDELVALRQTFGPYFLASRTSQSIDYTFPNRSSRMHLGFEVVSRAGLALVYCVMENKNDDIKYCYRVYEFDEHENHMLVDKSENGLSIEDESYWKNNFQIDKVRRIGAQVKTD